MGVRRLPCPCVPPTLVPVGRAPRGTAREALTRGRAALRGRSRGAARCAAASMSLAGSLCYSSLGALPQCWLSQAACTAFCAERDGNATGGCGVTTSLCAPSDAAAVNASNAALALVADAGGAFTCLQPPPVYSSDNLGWSVIPLIVGFMCGLFVLLFFLPSVLFQCNVLWPARFPLLSDFGATSIWTSRARESGRAASHDALRGGSGRLGPPAQLSWADSARLDKTRLRDEQEAAASRAANGKARLVDLALLGQWEELEVRILDRGSDTDAGAGAFGWLPLHHAARLGVPLKTLSLLLEAYPGAVNACTFDAVHGFSPVARATELQLLLLLALSAAAACVLPIAIAVCLTRTFVPLGTLGLCFGVGSVVFALVFSCLLAYFPVPFYFRPVEGGCILTHRDDSEASTAGRAAARLHSAMAALNACMPDRLKGRVWMRPSPARTPLGVAADELQRALLTHSPTAAALAEVVRALAWAAPHTLLRTSMVNTDFGRALLRDVVLSDSALLWRPYRDTASGGRTLTQLALAAREEAMRDGGGEPKSGAPDVGVLFTLLDAHMLFGLQPPPELLEALPKSMPGYYACFCELARFRYWGYEEEIKAAVRERETTVDPAYAHECKPVLFAAVGRQPVRLGQGGFAQVLLYRRQSLSADDAESTPAGAVAWEQPFTPGVAVKIYTPAATKELDAHATEVLDIERTLPAGNGAAGAPKAGARIAALLNETLLLRMMDHPHVVRFLDAKGEGDRLELYMQLAPGGDLDAAFAKAAQHVCWRAQGARLAREVASGLRYLHDKHKQAHRDLKVRNTRNKAQWLASPDGRDPPGRLLTH